MNMASVWQKIRNAWRKTIPLDVCPIWNVSSPHLINSAVFFEEAVANEFSNRFDGRIQRGVRTYQAKLPLMDYDDDMDGMLPYPLEHGTPQDIPKALQLFKRNPNMQNAVSVLDLAFSAQDTVTAVEVVDAQRGNVYSYHGNTGAVWEWELCLALGTRAPNQLRWLLECDSKFAAVVYKDKDIFYDWVLDSHGNLAETYWPWTSQHVLGVPLDPTDARWLSAGNERPGQIDISTAAVGFFITQLHEPAALMFMASALNSDSRVIEVLSNLHSPIEDIFGHYTRVLHQNEEPRTVEAKMLKAFQSLGMHPVEIYAMANSTKVAQSPSELTVPPMELLRF